MSHKYTHTDWKEGRQRHRHRGNIINEGNITALIYLYVLSVTQALVNSSQQLSRAVTFVREVGTKIFHWLDTGTTL